MNYLLAGLSQVASIFIEKVKMKVDEVNAPSNIKEAITQESPIVSGNNAVSIDVVVDIDLAPAAGAYEFGAEEYRIPADGDKFMAFPKAKWPQYKPPPTAPDVFVFYSVQHPKIVARPYLKPCIPPTIAEAKKILGRALKAELLSKTVRVEIIEP